MQNNALNTIQKVSHHKERWQIGKNIGHLFSESSIVIWVFSRLISLLEFHTLNTPGLFQLDNPWCLLLFWHRNKYTVESHANLWNRPFHAGKGWPSPHLLLEIVSRNKLCHPLCTVHAQSSTLHLSISPHQVQLLGMIKQVPLQYDFHYW